MSENFKDESCKSKSKLGVKIESTFKFENSLSLFNKFFFLTKKYKYVAFTLAEILITIGIIGIVAAITLPAVITNYQKQSTATKVKKFYNVINNAINMSIVNHGDVNTWYPERKNNTYDDNVDFLKEYILPYIKYDRFEKSSTSNAALIYLTNGGLILYNTDNNGTDIKYYINGKIEINPRNQFSFGFNKKDTTNSIFVEPYTFLWDGNYETLKTSNQLSFGCRKECTNCNYCTKLLQLNDWKFPDDYPW